jgi:tetratricopeptide (TPR) repeat protein
MDDVFARYQAALRSAHQLASEGKFKDALGQYEEAARVAGERPLPLIGIGGMNMRLNRPKEALAAYERALALEPDNFDALSGRAAALLATGKRSEAAGVQQQMAALRDSPRPLVGVPAELQTPLTSAETLAIAGEQARDAGLNDAAIDAWLAEAREEAAAQKFDAALDSALRALSLETGSIRVHLALTRLYFERGWDAEAQQRAAALRRLLLLTPDERASTELDELQRDFAGSAVDL